MAGQERPLPVLKFVLLGVMSAMPRWKDRVSNAAFSLPLLSQRIH